MDVKKIIRAIKDQADLNEIKSRQESTENFEKILITNVSETKEETRKDTTLIKQEKLL